MSKQSIIEKGRTSSRRRVWGREERRRMMIRKRMKDDRRKRREEIKGSKYLLSRFCWWVVGWLLGAARAKF